MTIFYFYRCKRDKKLRREEAKRRGDEVRELCGQAFATIGQLQKHQRQVHGVGSYRYPCRGCLLRFTTQQGLKDHTNRNNCYQMEVWCCMQDLFLYLFYINRLNRTFELLSKFYLSGKTAQGEGLHTKEDVASVRYWQLHQEIQVPQSPVGAQAKCPRKKIVSLRLRGEVQGPGMEFNIRPIQRNLFTFLRALVLLCNHTTVSI